MSQWQLLPLTHTKVANYPQYWPKMNVAATKCKVINVCSIFGATFMTLEGRLLMMFAEFDYPLAKFGTREALDWLPSAENNKLRHSFSKISHTLSQAKLKSATVWPSYSGRATEKSLSTIAKTENGTILANLRG
jgi:hypothetical protein